MPDVQVIVVPDSDIDASRQRPSIPSGILQMLGPDTILMSNDSMRCYMRASMWANMKDSMALAARR